MLKSEICANVNYIASQELSRRAYYYDTIVMPIIDAVSPEAELLLVKYPTLRLVGNWTPNKQMFYMIGSQMEINSIVNNIRKDYKDYHENSMVILFSEQYGLNLVKKAYRSIEDILNDIDDAESHYYYCGNGMMRVSRLAFAEQQITPYYRYDQYLVNIPLLDNVYDIVYKLDTNYIRYKSCTTAAQVLTELLSKHYETIRYSGHIYKLHELLDAITYDMYPEHFGGYSYYGKEEDVYEYISVRHGSSVWYNSKEIYAITIRVVTERYQFYERNFRCDNNWIQNTKKYKLNKACSKHALNQLYLILTTYCCLRTTKLPKPIIYIILIKTVNNWLYFCIISGRAMKLILVHADRTIHLQLVFQVF